jgi:hypothetical protein
MWSDYSRLNSPCYSRLACKFDNWITVSLKLDYGPTIVGLIVGFIVGSRGDLIVAGLVDFGPTIVGSIVGFIVVSQGGLIVCRPG